jgi:hypothetical protein
VRAVVAVLAALAPLAVAVPTAGERVVDFSGTWAWAAARGDTPVRSSPDTKQTQARWDGEALLLHAGPDLDVAGGSLRLWRLAADGHELREEIVNRGFGLRFDFKEASISRMYSRDKHVYIRKARTPL